MVIDVKTIKDLINEEGETKIVYKYEIDKMVADGEKIIINNPDPNYEFYIAVGDGFPKRCTNNGRTNCPDEADGTLATFLRKIIGKDHPNAILYVIDYSVHEVNFDVIEKSSITLNNHRLPIEVNYCANGTVKIKYNNSSESILSTYLKNEYDANNQFFDDITDIISNKLKDFANQYGESFDDEKKAYEFFNDKHNILDAMSKSLNKMIYEYQYKQEQSNYIIHRSDVIVTIQVPQLNIYIKSEGEKSLAASATIADQNRQQAIAMNKQNNDQALGAAQVKYEIEIDTTKNNHSRSEKVLNAQTDAEVRRINLDIQMSEDEYRLRMHESEKALQYKFDKLYSELNQASERQKMQFEIMRMQFEKEFQQKSQRTDVISGLLAIMSQQQLISDEGIEKIIEVCNTLLNNK